jgi:hypothetical protein
MSFHRVPQGGILHKRVGYCLAVAKYTAFTLGKRSFEAGDGDLDSLAIEPIGWWTCKLEAEIIVADLECAWASRDIVHVVVIVI